MRISDWSSDVCSSDPSCAWCRPIAPDAVFDFPQRRQFDFAPAQRAGRLIVPFRQYGLQCGVACKPPVVDANTELARLVDRSFDIEIAAGIDSEATAMFGDDDQRPVDETGENG